MVKVIRTLFFFPVFWLDQLLLMPQLLLLKTLQNRHPRPVRNRASIVGAAWGRLVVRIGGTRLEIRDLAKVPPTEAMLVVSNHQGGFDIPLLLGYTGRKLGFVAKKELGNIPLVSAWMRLIGCIFLDREDRRKQVEQIRTTIETLQSGHSMVIFPEGTRSGGPTLGQFAKGSLNIAQKAGVRIQPVSLDNSWALKPKGDWGFPGAKVVMTLHPPVDPSTLDEATQARLHEYIRDIIASGLSNPDG